MLLMVTFSVKTPCEVSKFIWERLGMPYSVHKTAWPQAIEELIREDEAEIVVQVNGKFKAQVGITPPSTDNMKGDELSRWSDESSAAGHHQGQNEGSPSPYRLRRRFQSVHASSGPEESGHRRELEGTRQVAQDGGL